MTPQAALLKASIDADIRELGVLIDIIRVLDLTGRVKSFGLEVLSCIARVLSSVGRVLSLVVRAESFGLEVLSCNGRVLNVTVEDWSVTAGTEIPDSFGSMDD